MPNLLLFNTYSVLEYALDEFDENLEGYKIHFNLLSYNKFLITNKLIQYNIFNNLSLV